VGRQFGSDKCEFPAAIILGKPFKNSQLHHLTPNVAVFILRMLHRSIPHDILTGKNMDKINVAAMEFYERGGPI
jgi:hypothetical protein